MVTSLVFFIICLFSTIKIMILVFFQSRGGAGGASFISYTHYDYELGCKYQETVVLVFTL